MHVFIISALLFLFNTCSEKRVGDERIGFINSVIVIGKPHGSLLYKEIPPALLNTIRSTLDRDTLIKFAPLITVGAEIFIFEKNERKKILDQLDQLKDFFWTPEGANKIKLDLLQPQKDTIPAFAFGANSRYMILPPIFFRNGEYCLFYFDFYCGITCGYGELAIYKKEKNEWKKCWSFYSWIS
jgi:hypothetical protein